MEKLKEGGWDNLEAAIGRTWEFAQTLVKNRVKTVIFPDPREKKEVSATCENRQFMERSSETIVSADGFSAARISYEGR